jgi:hypothetical protein
MTDRSTLLELAPAPPVYDKTGRAIEAGDILKVFHFVGARRKHYYMYKQVLGVEALNETSEHRYLKVGHLTFDPREYYHVHCDGQTLSDHEIVQSIDAKFEDRPRGALANQPEDKSQ